MPVNTVSTKVFNFDGTPRETRNMFNASNNQVSSSHPGTAETGASKPTPSRRRSIVREFALSTSTHGLPGIARSQSKHNALFWTVTFLIFTAVMLYFVIQSIKAYFQYPTKTTISMTVERSQSFPAVTLCNYSPGRYDLLLEPWLNYTRALNITTINDPQDLTFDQVMLFRHFLVEQVNTRQSVDQYFFSLNITLISCSYNGAACTAADFRSFTSPSYGLCYTFNSKGKDSNSSRIRSANDNGGSGKLRLGLYVYSHLYVPNYADGEFLSSMRPKCSSFVSRMRGGNGGDDSRQHGDPSD